MKRWREAEEKKRGERKGGREAGRGWANNGWRRGACGRRGDTANPVSGHYFVVQLTANKGVEDGWRDRREAEGEAQRSPQEFRDFLAVFGCPRLRARCCRESAGTGTNSTLFS